MSRVSEIQSAEGSLVVRSTVMNQEVEESESIKIRPFATTPARVRVNKGRTINLGNFESARVDVSIDVPCYKEEIRSVYEQVNNSVNDILSEEVNKVLSSLGRDPEGQETSVEQVL